MLSLLLITHLVIAQDTLKRSDTSSKLSTLKDNSIHAAKKVQVSVSIGKIKDYDTIVYSKRRQLSISDFKATQSDNPLSGAHSYCEILTSDKYYVQDSVVYLTVTVTPFFVKSRSYYQLEYRTFASYDVLAHEQLFFDITALNACDLVEAIKNYHFSPEYFEAELEHLSTEYKNESEKEKRQFHFDTRRGTDKFAEREWIAKIKKLLDSRTCY